MFEKSLSARWPKLLGFALLSLFLGSQSLKAVDFVVAAPTNGRAIFLASPAKVDNATAITAGTFGAGDVAVLADGKTKLLLMATDGSTNIVPTGVSVTTASPTFDAASNLWRKVTMGRQPRYVANLSSNVVYVSVGGKASNGIGLPLLPGTAPNLVGSILLFDKGEVETRLSVWGPAGSRIGYGEE